MELSKLKNMLRENGDKVIVMENGEPELVVMSFAEYEKLARLHIAESKNVVRPKPVTRPNESVQRSPDTDRHETEFIAPLDTTPIRTASTMGYDRPMMLGREESLHVADVRLEDLPI